MVHRSLWNRKQTGDKGWKYEAVKGELNPAESKGLLQAGPWQATHITLTPTFVIIWDAATIFKFLQFYKKQERFNITISAYVSAKPSFHNKKRKYCFLQNAVGGIVITNIP